jgi:hypothetical protein
MKVVTARETAVMALVVTAQSPKFTLIREHGAGGGFLHNTAKE